MKRFNGNRMLKFIEIIEYSNMIRFFVYLHKEQKYRC